MKFYFCEKCGNRLTDADIDSGHAKNKKLKGVYCISCANGILTMEMMPIAEAEAKKLIRREDNAAKRPSNAPPIHVMEKHPHSSRNSRPGSANAYKTAAAMGVASAIMVIAVLSYLSSPSGKKGMRTNVRIGQGEPDATLRAKAQREGLPEESKTASVHIARQTEGLRMSEPPREKAPPENEPVQAEHLQAADSVGRIDEAPPPSPQLESMEPAALSEAKELLPWEAPDGLLKEVAESIAEGGPETALGRTVAHTRVAPQTRKDLADAIQAIIDSRREGVASAKAQVGKSVDLSIGKEHVQGTLLDIDGDGLRIERSIVIDGEVRGASAVRIKRKALDPKDEARLWPRKFSDDAHGRFASALELMALGNLEQAAHALEHGEKHALAPTLQKLLEDRKEAAREAIAASAWEDLRERAAKAATQETARASEKELAAYDEAYGNTVFARAHMDQRNETKRQLSQMALGLEPKVAKAFHGTIASFDPKSLAISISYDFSDKNQLLDFQDPQTREKSPDRKWVPQSVTVSHYSKYDCHLWLPQFSDDVTLALTVKEMSRGSSGLAFRFLASDKSKISFRVLASKVSFEIGFTPSKKEVELENPLTPGTKLEISRKGNRFILKVQDKTVLDETLSVNLQDGVGIGGGASSSITISSVQLSGTLSMSWVQSLTDP